MLSAQRDEGASTRGGHKLTSVEQKTRIALVGGFRPTQCGIATFTTDVYEQLVRWLPRCDVDVYAVVRAPGMPVGSGAVDVIHQHDRGTYRFAAEQMNHDGIDAIWIQHEFGIFGGDCGEFLLDLLDIAAAPVIVTLHTVLSEPSPKQRFIIDQMRAKASRFVVMSKASKDILQRVYGVSSNHIHIVEHGAPNRPHVERPLDTAPVMMTFGLLGPGKGLETAIRSLPQIRASNPDLVYRIVGATHPNLVALEGERYRNNLKVLARELKVDDVIQWVERFLDTNELLAELSATDIYLTPYPNLAQSTSGTLSYAVALGCAVVSTPYVHAIELLADGTGCFVDPNSPNSIAKAVNCLLQNRQALADLRCRAYARGRQTIWSEFAKQSGEIISSVLPRVGLDRRSTRGHTMPAPGAVLRMNDEKPGGRLSRIGNAPVNSDHMRR